jgi:hypothetical protein
MHQKLLLNISSFIKMISIGLPENLDRSFAPRVIIESPSFPASIIWYSIKHSVIFFRSFREFLNRGNTIFSVIGEGSQFVQLIVFDSSAMAIELARLLDIPI